jgi:hypothetical protein
LVKTTSTNFVNSRVEKNKQTHTITTDTDKKIRFKRHTIKELRSLWEKRQMSCDSTAIQPAIQLTLARKKHLTPEIQGENRIQTAEDIILKYQGNAMAYRSAMINLGKRASSQ